MSEEEERALKEQAQALLEQALREPAWAFEESTWTQFHDVHSGGGSKEPYERIYIEAPEEEAKVIFYNRFGHNPERVSCTCCGSDYSVNDYSTLADASGYERNCAYPKEDGEHMVEEQRISSWYRDSEYDAPPHTPMMDYLGKEDVLVIRKHEIKDEERTGDVPVQGYVYV